LSAFTGGNSTTGHVPDAAFAAPEEFVVGILCGVFSVGGSVSENALVARVGSMRLAEGVAMLCSRVGVFSSIESCSIASPADGNVARYRVTVPGRWMAVLTRQVRLLTESTHQALTEMSRDADDGAFEVFNDVVLDEVSRIDVLGVEEHPKVYDLTIPSTLNFGLANGLQVRDTAETGYMQRRLMKVLRRDVSPQHQEQSSKRAKFRCASWVKTAFTSRSCSPESVTQTFTRLETSGLRAFSQWFRVMRLQARLLPWVPRFLSSRWVRVLVLEPLLTPAEPVSTA
jgi:hypothetical protein